MDRRTVILAVGGSLLAEPFASDGPTISLLEEPAPLLYDACSVVPSNGFDSPERVFILS